MAIQTKPNSVAKPTLTRSLTSVRYDWRQSTATRS
jgi:hypothetical protein